MPGHLVRAGRGLNEPAPEWSKIQVNHDLTLDFDERGEVLASRATNGAVCTLVIPMVTAMSSSQLRRSDHGHPGYP
jgi:hypothetical protein